MRHPADRKLFFLFFITFFNRAFGQGGYCFNDREPQGIYGRCTDQLSSDTTKANCCANGGVGWTIKSNGKRCEDTCAGLPDIPEAVSEEVVEPTDPPAEVTFCFRTRIPRGALGRCEDLIGEFTRDECCHRGGKGRTDRESGARCSDTCEGVEDTGPTKYCFPRIDGTACRGASSRKTQLQCCQDGGGGWSRRTDGTSCQSACVSSENNSELVDGGWTDWGTWGRCSVTCGDGTMVRRRHCTNPAPANGGAVCVGDRSEESICFEAECPIDGHWSGWSEWSRCPVTCGGGAKIRERYCDDPPAQHNGLPCPGDAEEERSCGRSPCPVDGGWTEWSGWAACSRSCEDGSQGRRRTCTDPAPAHGGADCDGPTSEEAACNEGPCPIHGGWGEFTVSVDCNAPCDSIANPIYKELRRPCNNPVPQFGGDDCRGPALRRVRCVELPKCPIDGGWTDWTSWSGCSKTCDEGQRTRERSCTNPRPQHGGNDCEGESTSAKVCRNPRRCPRHGEWTEWESWSACDAPRCGLSGRQTRARTCTNPSPKFGGRYCPGPIIDRRDCDRLCAHWSRWSDWGPCTPSCQNPNSWQSRYRKCLGEGSCPRNEEYEGRRDCRCSDDEDERCVSNDGPDGSGDGPDGSGDEPDGSGNGPEGSAEGSGSGGCESWNPICNDQASCIGKKSQGPQEELLPEKSVSYSDFIPELTDDENPWDYSINYDELGGGGGGEVVDPPASGEVDREGEEQPEVIPVAQPVGPVAPAGDGSSDSYSFNDVDPEVVGDVDVPLAVPDIPQGNSESDSYSFDDNPAGVAVAGDEAVEASPVDDGENGAVGVVLADVEDQLEDDSISY